jgi:dihydroxy-acid dehydratase
MGAKADLKAKLPTGHVIEGPKRAPHRSYGDAMGLTTEPIHPPFVRVARGCNEAAPCNMGLRRQAQAVAHRLASAGGTPSEFCTMTVTDGIVVGYQGMNSSLPSREAMADSVEMATRGYACGALVGLAGRDKSLPGMMMAMCRLNVPAIFIYGRIDPAGHVQGACDRPGRFRGRDVIELDAVMGLSTVKLSDEELTSQKREWKPRSGEFTSGYLWKYAQQVGPAHNGAVTHPGGGAETRCYADI